MSGAPTVTVRGDAELSATMRAAARRLAAAASVNTAAAEVVASAAARRAPHRTGALARSVRVVATATTAEVQAGARYARFVEYGTRWTPARPFLTSSAEATRGRWLPLYEAHVAAALASVRGM